MDLRVYRFGIWHNQYTITIKALGFDCTPGKVGLVRAKDMEKFGKL